MVRNQNVVTVPEGSELAMSLMAARANRRPVVIDTGERRYTVIVAQDEPADDIFARYDPQAAIAGLRALDEALAGVDREQLLRDLHAQRAQRSAGRAG